YGGAHGGVVRRRVRAARHTGARAAGRGARMRFVYFTHSLVSCWNHGNAHFLRGVMAELQSRGHDVVVYEPRSSWSRANLVHDHGEVPLAEFREAFPTLRPRLYDYESVDVDELVDGCAVVIVHEWT